MPKKYKLAVLIGRFQPFHLGHQYAVQRGLDLADKVLVLVGSATGPRTTKNPWTFDERKIMIHAPFAQPNVDAGIIVAPIEDYPYNDQQWIVGVQQRVMDEMFKLGLVNHEVVLIGHDKDASSFYLKFFPQWKFVDTGYEELNGSLRRIDATKIREFFFEGQMHYADGVLDEKVRYWIKKFVDFDDVGHFDNLIEEHKYIKKYKQSWAAAPYEPTFVTCDAVVVQSGHVLVVERGDNPGKHLLALPGGFLNPGERLEDGAIRELEEETSIKLQRDVLKRCIAAREVFDDPSRSLRGRTITHAFLFKLNDTVPLPKVKGADDARNAFWLPLAEVARDEFFEDHYHIIQTMVGKL